MVTLLLGPVLRHVGERDATVWVETDAACLVEVRAGSAVGREPTFAVAGHHYALVVIAGLEQGSSTPYQVRLDGAVAWPAADAAFPESRIRTVDPARPVTLLFGSCRESPALQRKGHALVDPDMLVAYAERMAGQEHERWPDLLVLMGDQVYADDTSPAMKEFIKSRRDIRKGARDQVADFEEYTRLYCESWGDPTVRWLLSTLPTSMIFDDHDVRDDWNTSHAWRLDMQKTDWWEERITGALMSYWIYQHLGNLSPAGLAASDIYEAVRNVPDAEPVLRSFAQAADREADGAKGTMWSYRRDLGPVRLLVIDSRCGRVLADGRRSMISDPEFEWVEHQVDDGGFEHLVVVTSMPWLLPRALHDIESWNEALCAGSRGTHPRPVRRVGASRGRPRALGGLPEVVRPARRPVRAGRPGRARRAAPGDHLRPVRRCPSQLRLRGRLSAAARRRGSTRSRARRSTTRSTCDARGLPHGLEQHGRADRPRALDRLTRVPPLPIHWHHPSGPHFGNMLGSVTFEGRSARARLERAVWTEGVRRARGRHGGQGRR